MNINKVQAGPELDVVAPSLEKESSACGVDNDLKQRITEASVRFEGFFITDLLKQMRRSTAALADADSAINDRVNSDMLELADQSLGDSMASQHAFGIADALVRQMLPPQDCVK